MITTRNVKSPPFPEHPHALYLPLNAENIFRIIPAKSINDERKNAALRFAEKKINNPHDANNPLERNTKRTRSSSGRIP